MYQAGHHELLASALAVSKGREINPEFRIGAMVSHVPIYPYSSHPDDVMLAEETMRQRFFLPGRAGSRILSSYALKNLKEKAIRYTLKTVMKRF